MSPMRYFLPLLSICTLSLLTILTNSGCGSPTRSPEQAAAWRETVRVLEQKARSGEILTVGQWETLLRQNKGQSPDWLFSLIGRPDQTLKHNGASTNGRGVYLIYKNKLLDHFTQKPTSLVFLTAYGYVGYSLYDEEAIRNSRR